VYALSRVFHEFFGPALGQQTRCDFCPFGGFDTVWSRNSIAACRPGKPALRRPVHLHPSLAIRAKLNVTLELSNSLFRELPSASGTRLFRRNQLIKFVVVEMSIKWPCQNQLLLLVRF
jgi:hypothetical protein